MLIKVKKENDDYGYYGKSVVMLVLDGEDMHIVVDSYNGEPTELEKKMFNIGFYEISKRFFDLVPDPDLEECIQGSFKQKNYKL